MNVALVAEIQGKGGAQRVILELAKEFSADIYAIPYSESFSEFEDFDIFKEELFVDKLPLGSRTIKNALSVFEGQLRNLKLDLSEYDLVIIAKDLAMFAGVRNSPNIYYCHGPSSYLFQQKSFYSQKYGLPFTIWRYFQKKITQWAANYIDYWVVNSETTQEVIRKVYGVDSIVIYPPVNVDKFKKGQPQDYFLSVQNLSAAKRVKWQIQAFNQLDEKLVIVGSGPEKEKLEEMANDNIEFKGSVEEKELLKLYSHCKGVIQTNPHEDFGIVPVEGMASGKPAICPKKAGFTETIIEGKTGVLFDEPFAENLKKKIENFNYQDFDPEFCQEHAKKFGIKRFHKRIRKVTLGNLNK